MSSWAGVLSSIGADIDCSCSIVSIVCVCNYKKTTISFERTAKRWRLQRWSLQRWRLQRWRLQWWRSAMERKRCWGRESCRRGQRKGDEEPKHMLTLSSRPSRAAFSRNSLVEIVFANVCIDRWTEWLCGNFLSIPWSRWICSIHRTDAALRWALCSNGIIQW